MESYERKQMLASREQCQRMGGILAMCQDLSMMCSGASSGSDEAMQEIAEALHFRLNCWQDSYCNVRYDNAVRELMHSAIETYRTHVAHCQRRHAAAIRTI